MNNTLDVRRGASDTMVHLFAFMLYSIFSKGIESNQNVRLILPTMRFEIEMNKIC